MKLSSSLSKSMINSLESSSHNVLAKGIHKSTIKHARYCFLLSELWFPFFPFNTSLFTYSPYLFLQGCCYFVTLTPRVPSSQKIPQKICTTLPCTDHFFDPCLLSLNLTMPNPNLPIKWRHQLGAHWGKFTQLFPTFINASTLNPTWHSADWSFRPVLSTCVLDRCGFCYHE